MAKLESTIVNMVVVLIAITALAGAALAGVYEMTRVRIAAAEKEKQEEAIRAVTPPFDNSPVKEAYKVRTADGDSLVVFPAKKHGVLVGAAVESITKKGFSGLIRVMVGFNTDGSVRNYMVLQHSETPGLGSKMQEWFSNVLKPGQCVIGKNPVNRLKVKKDGGDVDAITAATISSRAFLDAINRAYSAFKPSRQKTDAETSASIHD